MRKLVLCEQHLRSLISTFIVRCWDSLIHIFALSKFSRLLASFCSWAGRFESYLVANPRKICFLVTRLSCNTSQHSCLATSDFYFLQYGIVSLFNLLVREKGDTKDSLGMYLISQNKENPEMYEILCSTPKHRLQWAKALRAAVEKCPEEGWCYTSRAICEQQRRRSACASAQSDQHLCCSLPR